MTTKEKVTAADIAALRVQAGQSENRQRSAAMEFNHMPKSGIFIKPIVKELEIDGKKVKSVGLLTSEGDFVSESALIKSNITSDTVQIRNGARKGKFMLRMERLTDLSSFGKSQNEQLANLIGKKFETESKPIRQYKQQFLTSSDAFNEVVRNSENELKDVYESCTEIANGYVFNISDDETTVK
jgi:hypothetical protein